MHYWEQIRPNYHTFALFVIESPNKGSLMSPDIVHWPWQNHLTYPTGDGTEPSILPPQNFPSRWVRLPNPFRIWPWPLHNRGYLVFLFHLRINSWRFSLKFVFYFLSHVLKLRYCNINMNLLFEYPTCRIHEAHTEKRIVLKLPSLQRI